MSRSGGLWRDARGRLRSGWRVFLWLVGVSGVLVLASILGLGRLPLTVASGARVLLVALVSLLAWRMFDGRSAGETWLAVDFAAAKGFGTGFLVGILLVALALLPLAASGSFEILSRSCRLEEQGGFLLTTGALFLVAAALEELLFRGYPLFAIESGPGRVVAVAVTSALFAALHAANPHFDLFSAVVLTLIGAVLAISVLQRRSLWEAFGAHAGWNWTLASWAALPVSGLAMPSPCYSGALSGPRWVTGGGFGLEGSVAAAAVWALAAGVLWFRARHRAGSGSGPDARP